MAAFVALFLAAASLAWFAAHRVAATPSPEWDAVERMNELVASRQPEGANAWPIYQRFLRDTFGMENLKRHRGNDTREEVLRFLRNPVSLLQGSWSDPIHKEQRELFEAIQPLLNSLDEIAEAPGYARPYLPSPQAGGGPTPAIMAMPDGFSIIRDLARLNSVGLRAAAEADDWDEVVHRFRTGQAMARHLSFQASLIDCVIAISLAALIQDELRRTLNEQHLPRHVCEALFETLDRHAWPAIPIVELFESERILLEDFVQWSYTPGDRGFLPPWAPDMFSVGWPMLPGSDDADAARPDFFSRLTSLNPAILFEPDREDMMGMIDDLFAEIEVCAAPGSRGRITDSPRVQNARRRSDLLEFVAPSYESLLNNTRLLLTLQASLEVMLRLELHHARTGAWPESLLDAMTPTQTLDPTTGEPFRYERTENDEHGRPYILRAPDPYTHHVWMPSWPELNPPREPIPDEVREEWEAERQAGGDER